MMDVRTVMKKECVAVGDGKENFEVVRVDPAWWLRRPFVTASRSRHVRRCRTRRRHERSTAYRWGRTSEPNAAWANVKKDEDGLDQRA